MKDRSVLCPQCGQLMGSSQARCSWCNTPRPGRLQWAVSRQGGWLVQTILGANIVFFLLSLALNGRHAFSAGPLNILSPSRMSLLLLGATGTVPVVDLGRVWTLLAANYLHGGLLHIFFNMMALRQIAPWVSREYGPNRMFIIYTLSGIGGFLLSVVADVPFTIGASAAICGLIGALLYFGKSRGGCYGAAVYREVSGWVISLALFGFVFPGINNWGHGGGILSGIVLGKLLGYQEHGEENLLHRILSIACAAATAGVLVWAALTATAARFL
ncbi:rhomboid family intramembrane serine protease [Geomonas sp. RF6]|uniref:rhomboid family intramembrane serine protease n=1 Tax=Geomonas sp. RF6 TaxID=2897342 RepID=UPI001E46A943|nr:rhomboid family intramembrane serine protease [Geomonas sp. RF6]UFS71660.1 rhomboid family intramembrane serine protease [Geomonas sp. RF6]